MSIIWVDDGHLWTLGTTKTGEILSHTQDGLLDKQIDLDSAVSANSYARLQANSGFPLNLQALTNIAAGGSMALAQASALAKLDAVISISSYSDVEYTPSTSLYPSTEDPNWFGGIDTRFYPWTASDWSAVDAAWDEVEADVADWVAAWLAGGPYREYLFTEYRRMWPYDHGISVAANKRLSVQRADVEIEHFTTTQTYSSREYTALRQSSHTVMARARVRFGGSLYQWSPYFSATATQTHTPSATYNTDSWTSTIGPYEHSVADNDSAFGGQLHQVANEVYSVRVVTTTITETPDGTRYKEVKTELYSYAGALQSVSATGGIISGTKKAAVAAPSTEITVSGGASHPPTGDNRTTRSWTARIDCYHNSVLAGYRDHTGVNTIPASFPWPDPVLTKVSEETVTYGWAPPRGLSLLRLHDYRRFLVHAITGQRLAAVRYHYDDSPRDTITVDASALCRFPSFHTRERLIEGTYLRDGSAKLARSFDEGVNWTVVDVPGGPYVSQTSTLHRGRLILCGYRDSQWYVRVGVLGTDLSYTWGAEVSMGLTNPSSNGTLRLGQGYDVLEFAYLDTAGSAHVAQCYSLANNGTGAWI